MLDPQVYNEYDATRRQLRDMYSYNIADAVVSQEISALFERRRRARRQQRIAIALLVMVAVFILVLEAYSAH